MLAYIQSDTHGATHDTGEVESYDGFLLIRPKRPKRLAQPRVSLRPVAAAAWHSDTSRGKADCASSVIREKWRNESAFSPLIVSGKRKQFLPDEKSCSHAAFQYAFKSADSV